jgi:Cdc6-like AAA superfamily ATPase
MPVDAEIGFTSDVIKDPSRFVGRTELILDCIKALNTSYGLISVYGKRGVGKSSLLRQIQQMALGDYAIATQAGVASSVPKRPRKYLTVYYSADSMIKNGEALLNRLCNDQDDEDGLLRLVPNDGKELVEFERSKEVEGGADLKVVKWGSKGVESSKYARVVDGDIVQTFRNFINSIISHQVKKRMNRDSLLILIDEFDVIQDKAGIGSLIKSLSSADVKFGVCGIGRDLADLVSDHASVERLLEEGSIHVQPMEHDESEEIVFTAERKFQGAIKFDRDVVYDIADVSEGYPYFTQLIGKECVAVSNSLGTNYINRAIYEKVIEEIKVHPELPCANSTPTQVVVR